MNIETIIINIVITILIEASNIDYVNSPSLRNIMHLDQTIINLAAEVYKLASAGVSPILISTAESCTGGMLACYITAIPGSSKIFQAGLVTYSNTAKNLVLNISNDLIDNYSTISSECAVSMAQNCRILTKSNISLSITGIASPSLEFATKPVGLVYFAISGVDNLGKSKDNIYTKFFNGTREQIRQQACKYALEILWDYIYTNDRHSMS